MTTALAGRTITIGTRRSALALVQTEIVRAAILAISPELTVEVRRITTRGDAILDRSLVAAAVTDKGLFVEEIEAALRDGRIDLAVHSAKDLPSLLPPDMLIAAFTERADPRDVLVSPHGTLDTLPEGARVGTSSPRRACQLRAARPDLTVVDIRGNVDTRLRKLAEGQYGAIVLAAAGLLRLGREAEITEWFTPARMLPAVGQGALAIETRADDPQIAALLAPLAHGATTAALEAERAFLTAVSGGCSAVVAAYAAIEPGAAGSVLRLTGLIGKTDGTQVRDSRVGELTAGARLGTELASTLLAQGGAWLLAGGDGE